MPERFRVIPTIDRPARAIPVEVAKARVSGDYQCVVALPGSPSKGQLLMAYAEACRSMAELAEKWASDEGVLNEDLDDSLEDQDYRVYFSLSLRPEGGVDHDKVSTFAPQFRGL